MGPVRQIRNVHKETKREKTVVDAAKVAKGAVGVKMQKMVVVVIGPVNRAVEGEMVEVVDGGVLVRACWVALWVL